MKQEICGVNCLSLVCMLAQVLTRYQKANAHMDRKAYAHMKGDGQRSRGMKRSMLAWKKAKVVVFIKTGT
eukprot:1161719-Pelagomonas_calceolata.AAC.9